MPNGSALKTKVANSHAPGDESQPESRGELRRLRAVARDEQHAEEDDRHGEEDAGQRIGDRRLQDSRRHQEVEQEDDREGQHEICQERQDRVDPPAEIAGRKPQRNADRQREQRRQRRDDEHDARPCDDAAEHVARQLVAAEEIGKARARVDRARRDVLHLRDLAERIEEFDPAGEDRREQPEQDEQQAGEARPALHNLPVKPELAAVGDAQAQHDDEARPNRPELSEAPKNDLAGAQELHSASAP